MPLPSLNLGRYASALDDRILGAVAGSIGRGFSRAARSSVGPAARFAGKAAIGGGAALLGLGAAAVTTAVGLGYGAASLYRTSLNAPTFRANGLFEPPYLQRGGRMLTWQKHGKIPFTNKNLYSPMASARFSDMVGSVGLMGGIAGGVSDYQNTPGRRGTWTVTQALNTGALEVERDNFMGATGSLTLAMYKQRYGRPAPQEIKQSGITNAVSHLNQAEIVHAVHLAHMGLHG